MTVWPLWGFGAAPSKDAVRKYCESSTTASVVARMTECSSNCPRREHREAFMLEVRQQVRRSRCIWLPAGRPVDLYTLRYPFSFMAPNFNATRHQRAEEPAEGWRKALLSDGPAWAAGAGSAQRQSTGLANCTPSEALEHMWFWHHLNASETDLSLVISRFDYEMVCNNEGHVNGFVGTSAPAISLAREWVCAHYAVRAELMAKLWPSAIGVIDYAHEWPDQTLLDQISAMLRSCHVDLQRTIFLHYQLGALVPQEETRGAFSTGFGRHEWERWLTLALGRKEAHRGDDHRCPNGVPAANTAAFLGGSTRGDGRLQGAYFQTYFYKTIKKFAGDPEYDGIRAQVCPVAGGPARGAGSSVAAAADWQAGQGGRASTDGPNFLLLGGTARLWRMLVLLDLARRGSLSKGRYSFPRYGLCDLHANETSRQCIHSSLAGPYLDGFSVAECTKLLSDQALVRSVCRTLPSVLDFDSDQKAKTEFGAARDLWRDAQYGIVWDTAIHEFQPWNPVTFVTEKPLKPLLSRRPFIMLGNAGALGTLRALGFATFEPAVNESYDLMPDAEARTAAALAEVERLSRLTASEWSAATRSIQAAVDHNARHLLCGGLLEEMRQQARVAVQLAFHLTSCGHS